jgi:hypothetical protein
MGTQMLPNGLRRSHSLRLRRSPVKSTMLLRKINLFANVLKLNSDPKPITLELVVQVVVRQMAGRLSILFVKPQVCSHQYLLSDRDHYQTSDPRLVVADLRVVMVHLRDRNLPLLADPDPHIHKLVLLVHNLRLLLLADIRTATRSWTLAKTQVDFHRDPNVVNLRVELLDVRLGVGLLLQKHQFLNLYRRRSQYSGLEVGKDQRLLRRWESRAGRRRIKSVESCEWRRNEI